MLDTRPIDLASYENCAAETAVFFIKNGRRSFYSSILTKERPFIRIDPACMIPEDAKGVLALGIFDRLQQDPRVREIYLEPDEVLVLDNWRVLHARGAVNDDDLERQFVRGLAI